MNLANVSWLLKELTLIQIFLYLSSLVYLVDGEIVQQLSQISFFLASILQEKMEHEFTYFCDLSHKLQVFTCYFGPIRHKGKSVDIEE